MTPAAFGGAVRQRRGGIPRLDIMKAGPSVFGNDDESFLSTRGGALVIRRRLRAADLAGLAICIVVLLPTVTLPASRSNLCHGTARCRVRQCCEGSWFCNFALNGATTQRII
jgi:hypothetical protein